MLDVGTLCCCSGWSCVLNGIVSVLDVADFVCSSSAFFLRVCGCFVHVIYFSCYYWKQVLGWVVL